jgi:hypothetical protein
MEIIVLRDVNGDLMDYTDNRWTRAMRRRACDAVFLARCASNKVRSRIISASAFNARDIQPS